MQTLHLRGIATVSHVAHMLGGFKGERATEVLPALCTIEVDSEQGAYNISGLLGSFVAVHEDLVLSSTIV